MTARTDLISENEQFIKSKSGFITQSKRFGDCKLLRVDIKDEEQALQIGKPCGSYFTLSFPRLDTIYDTSGIKNALKYALGSLLPDYNGDALVVGLGNSDITPDALGVFAANGILATRHLSEEIKKSIGLMGLKRVAVLLPGVLGKTGIEASLCTSALASSIKPSAIIAIDALAAQSKERLCTTIQLSNTGISPGSGVKNSRAELSRKTLGYEVIAIGMPTVTEMESRSGGSFMVTPKEIDFLIKVSSELISRALNEFLQPEIDPLVLTEMA